MMRRRAWVAGGAGLLLLAGALAAVPAPHLVEIYPEEGSVAPGQPVHLNVVAQKSWYDLRPITVTITRGMDPQPVATLRTYGGTLTWAPPAAGGYGVTARGAGEQVSSAISVANAWTDSPRYGFLTDFAPTDKHQADRFQQMARFHLNGLQFYDWMYNHADYLPPAKEYKDPLGRLLSQDVLLEKIADAHAHGMAAMAYTAVYAAPPAFAAAHPDWRLYDITGHPMDFSNGFLEIMNPAAGSPWAQHIVGEYGKIVTQLPFDGVHLDQYGDPKSGFAQNGVPVDVGAAIVSLIDATKAQVGPNHAVIFNDVGGWPLADTAKTKNDAVYVEVWPPYVTFEHLDQLVTMGRNLSGGKPVMLAAYISPDYAPSVLLTDATIFAAGGSHIEVGEGANMLADPYFPKYKPMAPDLQAHLRRYYDVAVRYQDLLYGKNLTAWETQVTLPGSNVLANGATTGGVWPLARENAQYGVLSLINLNGIASAEWRGPRLDPPTPVKQQQVTVAMAAAPRALYLINPDGPDQSPVPIAFRYADGQVRFTLDSLAYWDLLVFVK